MQRQRSVANIIPRVASFGFVLNAWSIAVFLCLMGVALDVVGQGAPTPWLSNSWGYRRQVTISNPPNVLNAYQVQITLDGTFDFNHARSDGADLRVTSSDGTTLLPFWVEKWDPAHTSATLWVQVPSIPVAGTVLYLYYGNAAATSVSNGNSTFDFFDDFKSPNSAPGYFALSSGQTVLTKNIAWETGYPHTISIVQANSGGYQYWGYVGPETYPQGGAIGLFFSNDLVNWVSYSGNPIGQGRWPTVLKVGTTFYMIYTGWDGSNDYIKLATSSDGINFTDLKVLVPAQPGFYNDGPNLFFNSQDNSFYFYWANINQATNFHQILVRRASRIEDMDTASSSVVLSSPQTLAAPNMLYNGGTYFLSVETLSNSIWQTQVYGSTTSPITGFQLLGGNPILTDDSACMSQWVFGTTLHEYTCKRDITTGIWVLQHRTSDLNAGQIRFLTPDSTKWTPLGGNWSVLQDTLPSGSTGNVAKGSTTGIQLLSSSFSGSDYVLQAYGKQVGGRVWGLGARVNDLSNFYSANLYNDIQTNLVAYRFMSGTPTALGQAAAGTVSPGSWYKLAIKAHSSQLDIFKDDALMIHTADATFSAGKVGLYGEQNTVAEFNNVIVRKYASAEPTVAVGVAETVPSTVMINGLTLNPPSITGSYTGQGTVYLDGPAPSGGATVTLSSSNPGVAAGPASVVVPAGATNATFPIATTTVTASTPVTISGSLAGFTASATLTVTPVPALSSLSVSPSTIAGGSSSQGTVTLTWPASPNGTAVSLSSSSPSATVPNTVTVPAGSTTATFVINTAAVSSSVSVTITASLGTVTKSASLTLTATYSISGSVSPATSNVTMTLSGAGNATTTTDSNGNYVFNALANGTYTVTPSLSGYVFTPTSRSVPVNGSSVSAVNFTVAPVTFNPIRVNVGGPSYTDSSGNVWAADNSFSGGSTYSTTTAIQNTTTSTLYQSQRYGIFSYQFTVPSSSYIVTLKFAELYYTSPGSRSFGVAINGTTVLTNFDVVAQAGGGFTAIDKSFTVSSTGQITIALNEGLADTPILNAIEIKQVRPPGNYSISGSISPAMSNVTMTLSGDGSATTTTGGNGSYSFNSLSSGTYVVTPSLSGYTFTPTNQSVPVNGSSVSAINFTAAPLTFTPIRVNVGGPSYTDSSGNVWSADSSFTGGSTYSTTTAIQNTTDSTLYQTQRVGAFSYQFTAPSSTYIVTLKFAELYYASPGARSFSVAINGTNVLTNFDVVAQAGGAFTAIDRSFTVSSTGQITIAFNPGSVDSPIVNAIQIRQAPPPGNYSISGSISPAMSNVTMTLGGAGGSATTTDANGNYSFTGLSNATYTVTPSLSGYVFAPTSQSVPVNGSSVSAVNFTATKTIAWVQNPVGTSCAGASCSASFLNSVGQSNLLVAFVSWTDTTSTATVSDTRCGSNWTNGVGPIRGPSFSMQILFCVASSAGSDSVRATLPVSQSAITLAIFEYKGNASNQATVLDVSGSRSTPSTQSWSVSTTTAAANDLLFVAAVGDNGRMTLSSPALTRDSSSGNVAGDQQSTAAGSYTLSGTTGGVSANVLAGVVAFRAGP